MPIKDDEDVIKLMTQSHTWKRSQWQIFWSLAGVRQPFSLNMIDESNRWTPGVRLLLGLAYPPFSRAPKSFLIDGACVKMAACGSFLV